jgi:O-antigen/teichoic acid export membrane protein
LRLPLGDLAAISLAGVAGLVVPHVAAICQAQGRWGDISCYQVMSNLLRAMMIPAAVFFAHPAARTSALWASAAALLAAAALVAARERIRLRISPAIQALRAHLKDFWNLALSNTVVVVASRADVLLAGSLLVPNDLGAYSAASTLALGMGMVQSAIMSVSLHDAASSQSASRLVFHRQRQLLAPVALAISLTLAFSSRAIPLLFGSRYAAAATPFKFLAIALFLGILFAPVESHFSAHASRNSLWLKVIQLALLLVLAAVMKHSLTGLAAAVLISRCCGWGWALCLFGRIV